MPGGADDEMRPVLVLGPVLDSGTSVSVWERRIRSAGPASRTFSSGVEAQLHPDRGGRCLNETLLGVQRPTRRVREQIDASAGGSAFADTVQECGKDRIAKAPPLMFRQHCHVDHVEVPASVSEHPSHANDLAPGFLHDMASSPTTRKSCPRLFLGLRCQPRYQPQPEVVGNRWRCHDELVARSHVVILSEDGSRPRRIVPVPVGRPLPFRRAPSATSRPAAAKLTSPAPTSCPTAYPTSCRTGRGG
jgi:hypothetical protein